MLWLHFSRRYLFSAKSHSVINIISGVSVIAVGIPVAAMIILMSVFNGFSGLVDRMYTAFDADLQILPHEGKTFEVSDLDTAALRRIEGVSAVSAILEESALAEYNGRQAVVTVRGVDDHYQDVLPIEECITTGSYDLQLGQIEQAVVGQGIAYNLGVRPVLDIPIRLYAPRRGHISTLLPLNAYTTRRVWPVGIYTLDSQTDSRYILTSLDFTRTLFNYPDRATSLLIRLSPGASLERVSRELSAVTGERMDIRTLEEQQQTMYRIMKYEKWSIFFISLLVLIIASFSMVGSLAMLIIEKRNDISTLRAMGAPTGFIRRIFTGEGMLIGGAGALVGLVLGIGICWLQQRYGVVEIPAETFIVKAYPVEMRFGDILTIIVSLAAITFVISRLTVYSMIRRGETAQDTMA